MDSDRSPHDGAREPLRDRRVKAVVSGPENAVAAERVLAALGLELEDDDRRRRIPPPSAEEADELAAMLAALR
jgi:hypothetical protein